EYHARIYGPLALPRFSLRQTLCTVAAQRVFLPLTATLRRSRCRGFALYTPNRTGSWHSSEGRTLTHTQNRSPIRDIIRYVRNIRRYSLSLGYLRSILRWISNKGLPK